MAGCRSSDAEVAENEARRRLRARDDPRNTSAGMRARAGKIEVLDARVAVVPAKIGALQQCWRQAEGAPEMRGEILFEVRRRLLDLRDDPLAKVRDQSPTDLGEDALRPFRSEEDTSELQAIMTN